MLRIGEAAARTGVSERTLRYYEQIGLLCPSAHSPGGARRYGEAELERVRRVRELQDLMGLNLEEIRALLAAEDRLEDLRAAWRAGPALEERRRILEEALATRARLRERVSAKRDRLEAYLEELDAHTERVTRLLAELELGDRAVTT